ncbi:tetratricopeptide repeat protein [Lewinella sp. LCG006]|uniref:tetratricopeptide repeat protein n=1 Tax=Lewinella sp. LCG006 TaxID=3231911 RepID=UPI00345F7A4E
MLSCKKLAIGFLLLCSHSLGAQPKSDLKEEAKAFIATEHYEEAIQTLERSRQLVRTDVESQFLIAVCYYQLNRLEEARQLLASLTEADKSPYPECWLYLGKIFHAQQLFEEAAAHYKLYLRTLRPDHSNRPMVIEEIRRCDNGLRLRFHDAQAIVENMGSQVNTSGDEFAPVLSPSRSSQLYFSAIRMGNSGGPRDKNTRPDEKFGRFLSDMFSTQLEGGQWQQAKALHPLLNSPQHEYLIGFSGQGKVLLYYQGWNWERGEIFADTFQQSEQRTLTTTPLLAPVRGQNGEQQLFVYNDTLILFVSRKAGGYGGLDLYQTSFRNGQWQVPVNMGPEINSAFDETTPFLARDGKTLYYSTNDSRKSIGGLDVMRTVYLPEAARWSPPENMGIPINSADDDSHFRLARDGFTGFLASARKDGMGQRDLYVAYFTKYRQEMEPPTVVFVQPEPVTSPPTTVTPPIYTPPASTPTPVVVVPTTTAPSWQTRVSTLSTAAPNWLTSLGEQARQYPGDHLILTCYVPQQRGVLSGELYSGLEALAAYSRALQANGVAPERIFLRALAHNEQDYQIDAHLAPTTTTFSARAIPVIGTDQTKSPADNALGEALCYKVQVMSVQRSVNDQKLSQRPQLMLEQAMGSPYQRFTAGAYSNFAAAENFRRELVSAGYKGAYIVPYLYGRRLEKGEATQYVESFPDLRNFLGR